MTDRNNRAKTRHQALRFGERIDRARQRKFMTVTMLAEAIVEEAKKAGVELTLDRSAVSRWIAGENEPHMKYRPFTARALDMDPHDLFEPVQSYGRAA